MVTFGNLGEVPRPAHDQNQVMIGPFETVTVRL